MKNLSHRNYTKGQIEKLKKGKCITRKCKNNIQHNRHRCGSCITRSAREKNPVRYAFETARANAKRRGKKWGLSFEYFKDLAEKENYIEFRGIYAACLSLDRIENELGYIEGNVRVVTVSHNSLKRNYVDYFRRRYSHEESKRIAGTPF